jgi:hypothetical protein
MNVPAKFLRPPALALCCALPLVLCSCAFALSVWGCDHLHEPAQQVGQKQSMSQPLSPQQSPANNSVGENPSNILFVDRLRAAGHYPTLTDAVNACAGNGGCTIFDGRNEIDPILAPPYPVHIYASGTWLVTHTLVVPAVTVITGTGHPGSTGNGWSITAGSGFPANNPLVQLGSLTAFSPGARLEDVAFDCKSVPGSYAVLAETLAEQSGLQNFSALNCPGSRAYPGVTAPVIDINSAASTGSNEYFNIQYGDMQPGSGSTGSCIYIHGADISVPSIIGPLTCNSGSGTQGSGIVIDSSVGGTYLNIHGEHLANVIRLGLSSGVGAQGQVIINPSGATTITGSVVEIGSNPATTDFWIQNAQAQGARCTIVDNGHYGGLKLCDWEDSVFVSGTGAGLTYLTGSPNFGSAFPKIRTSLYTVSSGSGYPSLPAASSVPPGTQVIVVDSSSYSPGVCKGGGKDMMIAVSDQNVWSCH